MLKDGRRQNLRKQNWIWKNANSVATTQSTKPASKHPAESPLSTMKLKTVWIFAIFAFMTLNPKVSNCFLFGPGPELKHLDFAYESIKTLLHHPLHKEESAASHAKSFGRGINGGFPCAACTVLISLAEQLTQLHNATAEATLQRMCSFLPAAYQSACDALIGALAPLIAAEILAKSSPDTICYGLRICYVDPEKQMCNLFPLPPSRNDVERGWREPRSIVPKKYRHLLVKASKQSLPWVCNLPGVYELCEALDNAYGKLTPALDLDGDRFSTQETLRGTIWRGRDCNDLEGGVRPGRRAVDDDRDVDSNCNGIHGVNAKSGRAWEEELCGGSGARGVIYVGDSVGAHFHAPPAWFTPAALGAGIWDNLTYVLANEGDWPDLGFATGFRRTQMPALIDGDTDSIYLRLRERNRCNHRDYQNLARNGDNSNDALEHMLSISRRKLEDRPALVFYSLIGNDVCNEKPDTEAFMTPADVFRNNTMTTLRFLEENLPPESHVILVGLIDGSILWDAMAHRYHPLGQLNKDLKYSDMYRWFNCMEMGPCHGWMTANATLRRITTKHARKLTRVLQHVAQTERFDSFDIHFVENPFKKVINDWLDQGGEVWELIEPVDSLHPTQAAQALIADAFWRQLEAEMPQVLGPPNHRNHLIKSIFGDQGGH